MLKFASVSFILRGSYLKEFTDDCMMQLLVRDVDARWRGIDSAALIEAFGVRPPQAPAMQPWAMKVDFLFDSSAVLSHVA